jgi:hypothetical protein
MTELEPSNARESSIKMEAQLTETNLPSAIQPEIGLNTPIASAALEEQNND